MDPYKRPWHYVADPDRHGNRSLAYRKERRRRHWEARKARMRRPR